ncbi:alpha/beta hydrolase [Cordyceps javanica]|uniref:Alpha/beta hydrolase n=1 Tax=Cordyceps javanica TaxID=43265 RepID=A0A545UQC5_9HYPO|nr:alpha/beta hydrolase [Cordyceps javanica]TQW03548.1 alpha/beta hydrolase [Cordyceps javanica]
MAATSSSSAASTPGILYVTMQPHPDLEPAQFHEWYNNEHGPTRLAMRSIFSNGLRYHSTDTADTADTAAAASPPTFMAVYDVRHMPLLATPTYTDLRANRSPREAATIARVDVVRAFYDLLHTKQAPSFRPLESRTDAELAPPGTQGGGGGRGERGGIVTVAVEISLTQEPAAGDEYRAWYIEEHVEMLARVPGWLRSRLFKKSSSATVQDAAAGGETTVYFCLHDYEATNGLGGPAHAASMDTPRRAAVFDKYVAAKSRQTFSLFYVFGPAARDLHSLAQLRPPPAASSPSSSSVTFVSPDGGASLRTDAATPSITSCIRTDDGLVIPYRLEGSPEPGAPVVVLSNSLLTSYAMWDPLVAVLRRARPDLRVLRYDTRGRHAVPPADNARLADLAADLEALRAALRVERFACVVGVSMGGATALRYALTHPARVGRLVAADFNCAAAAANTQAWRDRIAVARGEGGMAALAGQTVARWFHPATPPETAAWMTGLVAANDVEGFARSCTALWDYDMRPEMPGCAVPALLVAGEADGKGVLVKAMEGFKGLLGEKGAELRVVPRTGHLPMCEDPEGFWEAIEDFMEPITVEKKNV